MTSSYPPDDLPPPRHHAKSSRRPARDASDDYDYYDRRHPRKAPPVRAPRHDSPVARDRPKPRRRNTYDSSDDGYTKKSASRPEKVGSRRDGARPAEASPSIPRPPIGSDRDGGDDDEPSQTRAKPDEDERRAPPSGRSGRHRHGESGDSLPYRERRREPKEDDVLPRRHRDHNGKDYARDDYLGGRRKKDDRYRSRHHADNDNNDDDNDEDIYRSKPSRYDDGGRDRHRGRDGYGHDDRGYHTEAPRRRYKDYPDRGYRTDHGRDSKRDRERERQKRRSGYDDDYDRAYGKHGRRSGARDRYDDYYERDPDDMRRSGSGRHAKKKDIGQMWEQGQKHWKTVEPIAKPMLSALAKKYLAE